MFAVRIMLPFFIICMSFVFTKSPSAAEDAATRICKLASIASGVGMAFRINGASEDEAVSKTVDYMKQFSVPSYELRLIIGYTRQAYKISIVEPVKYQEAMFIVCIENQG